MADANAPSGQAPEMAPPVHTDDQILPRIRWVPNGKSNCYLDLEKSQGNPIYKIAVDLLKNTNFFRALTASSTIPSIYIQQFWDTVQYDKKARNYRCQLDEQWIWEEFVQSIHTFVEDKWNLSWHTTGKKRATLIVIPSNRFTKLIIHYLQRRHKFHPRPASPPHLPNEEPVLGYLKFSAKGTKSEVFGMPIPAQLAPTSAPAKPLEKKRKQATETSDKPPKAKKSKYGWVSKKRTLKHVATLEAEDVPIMEPQVAAEDAELQKVLEESMKTTYDVAPRGPLPPVVIREPESGKYQPLSEVPGTGKAKVTEEQSDSEEESEKVVLGATEGGNDEHQAGPDPGIQAEGQTGIDAGTLDEGQAGSNPDEMSEGQAGPDPGNTGDDEQSIPSLVVDDGSDREHMDLDVADVSPQPSTEQLDEGFTATAYPKVQENLKLVVEEQVFDKPSEAKNDKTAAETEVESMVSVTIQQEMSSIPPIKSPIIDLSSRPESPKVHQQFIVTTTETTTTTTTTLPPPPTQPQSNAEAMMIKRISELEHIMANLIQVNKEMEVRLDKHGARLYMLEQLDIPQQVSKAVSEVVTEAVDWAMQAPLQNRFRDLPEADMKEILHQRMSESISYKSHEDHMQLFEALEKSMNHDQSEELAQDLAEARKKKKKSHESSKTPPGSPPHQPPHPPPPAGPSGAPGASRSSQVPPPPPLPSYTNQESPSKGSAAPSSSKTAAPAEYQAWTMTEVNLRQDWWKPLEEERPATPEPAWSIPSSDAPTGDIAIFIDWFYKRRGITKLKPQDLEGPAFEIVKVFHPDVIHLQYQMEECHKLLTDSVDDPILRHNFWIKEECKYDIAAMYGISHWWFQRQRFYIDRHTSEGDRGAVRTHMRILGVVRIEVFSLYGYDYMKKIVLRHADLNEHVIAERDFKYLYPSDFENLYLLNLQVYLNHLPPKDKKILSTAVNQWTRHLVIRQCVEDFQLGIESYQTQLNLTKPQWDTTGFDDGTLQQIDEALDYRVKEFQINMMNPGLNTRFWTRKDVDRSKAFMFAIQRRLKTRRIFRNLESFIGGRLREGDYRLLKQFHAFLLTFSLRWVFNSLVHSFRALSALRRFGLRTASTAAKPCQGDSSEFYLITGNIYTDQRGIVVLATLFNGSEQRHLKDLQHSFRNSDVCCYAQEKCGYGILMSQLHKMAMFHNKDGQRSHKSKEPKSKSVLKVQRSTVKNQKDYKPEQETKNIDG
nr:hypothetical protein [Tanacetum cinerariifolium]